MNILSKFNSANFEDIIQVVVGASALAVPIAFSEESWNLSNTLPMTNVIFLVVLSLVFINLFTFQSIYQGNIKFRLLVFLSRTILVYLITLFVVSIVLVAMDKLPLLSEPIVALKRIIIISFPASMGGVVVDSLDKE